MGLQESGKPLWKIAGSIKLGIANNKDTPFPYNQKPKNTVEH